MSNMTHVIEVVEHIVGNRATAELVVDRLLEEGWLHVGHGNADIDKVVEQFQELFGTTKTSRQDRWAANRLCQKYGAQSVIVIMQLLAANRQQRYAPVIGSVSQLETKWVSVEHFLRNLDKGEETIE